VWSRKGLGLGQSDSMEKTSALKWNGKSRGMDGGNSAAADFYVVVDGFFGAKGIRWEWSATQSSPAAAHGCGDDKNDTEHKYGHQGGVQIALQLRADRKSTRLNSSH